MGDKKVKERKQTLRKQTFYFALYLHKFKSNKNEKWKIKEQPKFISLIQHQCNNI